MNTSAAKKKPGCIKCWYGYLVEGGLTKHVDGHEVGALFHGEPHEALARLQVNVLLAVLGPDLLGLAYATSQSGGNSLARWPLICKRRIDQGVTVPPGYTSSDKWWRSTLAATDFEASTHDVHSHKSRMNGI